MREKNKPYPEQFRLQMVELVKAGRKPRSIAFGNRCKEMGVRPSMGTVDNPRASTLKPFQFRNI